MFKNTNNMSNTVNVSTKEDKNMKMEMTVRRNMFVTVNAADTDENQCGMVAALVKNIQSLGFTLSLELMQVLSKKAPDFITSFYMELVSVLKKLVGADKEYAPMYPNFPQQVLDASEAELFWNAIIHYLSCGTLVPDYTKNERFPLVGEYNLKEIRLGTDDEVMNIFRNLLSSKTALSAQDKADVEWFVENTEYVSFVPAEIPMKETKAFFGNLLIGKGDIEAAKCLYKTATDVLRLMAAVSDSDTSLAAKIRFKKFSRKERRFFMELLASCKGEILEDMFRYRALWVTAGEIIHPGDFSKDRRYTKVLDAFVLLRENEKPLFFAGKVEEALLRNDWKEAVSLLETRPGEFCRKLDQLLRMEGADTDFILARFEAVSDAVATRVLWQAKAHFMHRNDDVARIFFPKGDIAKGFVSAAEYASLPAEVAQKAADVCGNAILKQYADKPEMGKVFIDPAFSCYAAPFSQRSASSGFKQVARGSRLPLSDSCKCVRPFIWWTNTKDGEVVDIDLSASLYDSEWNHHGDCAFYGLRIGGLDIVHSGDIVNGGRFGGKGVSEFIDFNPDVLAENGIKYVVMSVRAFSRHNFSQLPCSFGWMERSDSNSGEVYDPRTVENFIALTADARTAIPAIIDCENREVIWADMVESSNTRWFNTAAANINGSTMTSYAVVHWNKPSLYDIVLMNAVARGTVVATREEADVIFSNDPTKPMEQVFDRIEDGKPVFKEVEKPVTVRDAFDLAFYMGEMI
jgi:hypothetical protein